jgi:hypothetical protein
MEIFHISSVLFNHPNDDHDNAIETEVITSDISTTNVITKVAIKSNTKVMVNKKRKRPATLPEPNRVNKPQRNVSEVTT